LQPDSGVNFYEKLCLRGVKQSRFDNLCQAERGWAFERVVGGLLEGFNHKEINNIETRGECARLCLLEDDFPCRSAEYNSDNRRCILSRDDRRTQPEAFRFGAGDHIDYIENQCSKPLPDCSYTVGSKDVTVVANDDILYSRTVQDCQRFCDDARAFNCRSFAQKGDRCYLSGDDSTTLPDTKQPVENGATYKEKVCTRSTCDGGIFAFEKTTAHFLRTGRETSLDLSSNTPGITSECAALCQEKGAECPAFTIDYNGQRCASLDRNTQGRGDELAERDGTNYFEKICLRGAVDGCRDKTWAFERVLNRKLEGFDDKIVEQVPNRRDCEELCLAETSFACLSADYNIVTLSCALSRDSRRTQPASYITSRDTEYLENSCVPSEQLNCPYKRTDNAYPRYLDTIVTRVTDEIACERQCTFFEDFPCRSFAFYTSASQCFISGDDQASARSGSLQSRPGTDYFERSCETIFSSVEETENLILDTGATSGEGVIGGSGLQTALQGTRCTFGKLEFEKTTGYELIRAQGRRLHSRREGGISGECAARCKDDSNCKGYNMDYNRNECQSVIANSEDNLFNLRSNTGIGFFEAICLRGRTCGAVWTFERYIDYELRGFVRETQRNVSKTECEDFCLSESRFSCRSATYDHLTRLCYLSEQDRFTQPESLVPRQGSDYLENQCESRQSCRDFSPQTRGQYLIYTDKSVTAFTDTQCRQACSSEREFNCRSYSFLSETRSGETQCLLSGDTKESAGGTNAFQLSTGALYAERECGRQGRPTNGISTSNQFDQISFDRDRESGGRPIFDNVLGQQQLPDDEEEPLPGYTPTSNFGNCASEGKTTAYEKVVDVTYNRGTVTELTTRNDIGIATECLQQCTDAGASCLSVILNNERGGRQSCSSVTSSAVADQTDPTSATGVTYFEKICISNGRGCNKDWAFTRVPQYEFVGTANEEVQNVESMAACRELCLASNSYVCRSATYYTNFGLCKLSEETRRSSPQSFRPAQRGTFYLENECAVLPANCEYIDMPGNYLPFTDTYIPEVADLEGCRDECNRQSSYNCRSFNYNPQRRECFLSSDDSISLPTQLQQDSGFIFSEKSGCNNVKVECTPSDMLVTLSFGQEFNGRVYATGNPQACFELGTGQTEISLRIPIGTQCGSVQSGKGRYVNHVVIQANPVIMQDTDKTVRIECVFAADDQTVSFRPTAGSREDGGGISVTVPFQPTGTNVVTNTAPTPGVRMRVVRRLGANTADVVGLGEDLQLRIEIDQDSAFGLFARNLEARTDNGELLNLIDQSGCPLNELIFPSLGLEGNTRALIADFKAFRFPSTPTVNFVATVQFCQELCDPSQCTGELESYGRKRRSVGDNVTRVGDNVSVSGGHVPDLLPDQLMLGLRLTVGEDQITKPHPPSRLGRGNFPERRNDQVHDEAEQYYPGSISTYDIGDPSYICSPQSTIIAAAIVVLLLNFSLIAGFIFFYRLKRKTWSKTKEVEGTSRRQDVPPPLPPHNSRHQGEVMYRNTYDKNSSRSTRFHDNPTIAGMSRHQGH